MNESKKDTDSSKTSITVMVKSDLVPDSIPKKKTLLNFSDQGQKALISAYNSRTHTNDELKGLLGGNYFTDDDKSNVIDFTKRTISLTISVQNRDFFGVTSPDSSFADRLEKIRFHLALDQNDVFKFKSWNKVNTQFGRFYVGSRAYTGSITPTLSPSIGIGTVTASAGSLAATRQYAETDTVSEQYVSSNGVLFDDSFTIEQDGTPKTTLMGNTILQLTIKAKHIDSKPVIAFDKLTGDDDKPISGDKVKLTKKTVLFAIFPKKADKDKTPRKLTGKLTFDYVLRHVDHNFRTFAESDDEITYHYGTVSGQNVDLLGEDDLGQKLFYLTLDGQFLKLRNTAIRNPSEQYGTVAFLSDDEALAFLDWLLMQTDSDDPIRIGGRYQVEGIGPDNMHFVSRSRNYLNAHKIVIIEE
jgi:hypothetical protein